MDAKSPRLSKHAIELAAAQSRFCTLNPLESTPIEPAVLHPLAAEADLVNFSGSSGTGKTTLAADVAIAWLHPKREGRALGGLLKFSTGYRESGNIAIIDGENSRPRWQSQLRRMLEAEGLDPLEFRHSIKYVNPAYLGLQQVAHWRERSILLAEALKELNVVFVILDSLGRIWCPDEINSTPWVQQGLTAYRDACKTRNITTLALSHTRRRTGRDDPGAVGPLGSSMQEGQVDTQVIVTMDPGGKGIKLKLLKCRRAFWINPGSTVTVRFSGSCGYKPQDDWAKHWPHECPYIGESLEEDPSRRAQIINILENTPDRTMQANGIAAQLGCTKRTATSHLHALEALSRIERVGAGPSTAWRLVP